MDAVAVFKAERGLFGKRAVVNAESRPRLRQCLQRGPALVRVDVVQYGMAVAERAPLHILPRQADGSAVRENGRERQRFGVSPQNAVWFHQSFVPSLLEGAAV